jgi:hypothetical protein
MDTVEIVEYRHGNIGVALVQKDKGFGFDQILYFHDVIATSFVKCRCYIYTDETFTLQLARASDN